MQTLIVPSILLSIVVGTIVGVRLLLMAARTRRFPEFAVGIAVFAYAAVAQTALVVTQILPVDASFASHMLFAGLCISGYYVMLVGLSTFTWHVFGAESAWRRALTILITFSALVGSGVTFWANWQQFETGGQMPIHGRIGITPQYIIVLGWMSIESLRYWRLMRRRQALGLADAQVTTRFAIWGISAGIGSVLLVALFSVSLTRDALFQDDPLTSGIVSAAGLVNAAGWWLTFMPPLRYSRWLKGNTASAEDSLG